ncbi:ankyrin-3-like isoform X3 [Struthio camelus]
MAEEERETLLALQLALSEEQFQAFKYLLEGQIPLSKLRPATRPDLCSLLLQHFPGQALHKTSALFRQLSYLDLIQRFQLPGWEDVSSPSTSPGRLEDKLPAAIMASSIRSAAPCFCPAGKQRVLLERELMQVAQKMGREWQEVGIQCLGLERSRLDQIREDNPNSAVMQIFEMLREWRRREKQHATAQHLYACLARANMDPEVLSYLQSIGGF